MLRRWSKSHLLTVGLDTLRLQAPDNTLQILPVKLGGKQLLPDLADLSEQLALIASQLRGQPVAVRISQPLMRYQLLPWQKAISRRQDWLEMATQRFLEIYGPLAQQWQYQICFQGYGQPVLAIAADAGLLALIDEQAQKANWQLKGVVPELLALTAAHRQKIKANDWLLLGHSAGYFLLAVRQKHRWQAVQMFTTGPVSLVNTLAALLKQHQQHMDSLANLTLWTDIADRLPPHIAGVQLKPLDNMTVMRLDDAMLSKP